MKFLLKFFVLVFLIVVSKLAKDQKVTLPVPQASGPSEIFTQHIDKTNLKVQYAPVSAKFEKSELRLN